MTTGLWWRNTALNRLVPCLAFIPAKFEHKRTPRTVVVYVRTSEVNRTTLSFICNFPLGWRESDPTDTLIAVSAMRMGVPYHVKSLTACGEYKIGEVQTLDLGHVCEIFLHKNCIVTLTTGRQRVINYQGTAACPNL